MSFKERRLSARLAKAKAVPHNAGTSLDVAPSSPRLELGEFVPQQVTVPVPAPANPDPIPIPIESSARLARSPVGRASLAANTAANAAQNNVVELQPSKSKASIKSKAGDADGDVAGPSLMSYADAAEDKVTEAILELVRRSGVKVLKVGRKGPARRAQLQLSKDGGRLVWKSKRTRKEDGIVLANVRRVTVKQVSRNFSRINRSSIFRHTSSPIFDPRSLSMFDNTTKKSLDVVVQPSKLLLRTVLELRKKGLIMEKEDEMALVVETIRNEVERRAAILQAEPVHLRYVKKLFEEADLTKKGTVNLKEALTLCKKIQLGQSAKVVTLAFEALASVEAWPGSSKKKVGELNLEGFEALLMELGGNHDEASLWATLHLQHLDIALISAQSFAKANSRKLITPSDTLHEFLMGCAKGSTVDYAETKIDISSIVNMMLKIQGESPQAAVAFLRKRQLQVPRTLRVAAKNARRRAREVAMGGQSAASSNAAEALGNDGSDSGSDSDTEIIQPNVQPTAKASTAMSPSYERQKLSDAKDANKPAAVRRASQLLAFNAVTAAALATCSRASANDHFGNGETNSKDQIGGGEVETSLVSNRSQKAARRSFLSMEGAGSEPSEMLGMLSAATQALFSQADAKDETIQLSGEPKRSGVTFGNLSSTSRTPPKCGSEVFSALVNDPDNTLLRPVHLNSVYQDMDRPLSEYWIASSHNTYLTGDQLASASSVDRYIDDLMEGCRCVEIDTWDSRDGSGEPVVYHGGTLTSKILFRDVIQAIGDYGFVNNPYPIILSFENHCSKPYQLKMAEYIKKSLHERGLLWLPPESTLHPDGAGLPATRLPSPNEAKNFVLVKAKVKRFKDKKRSKGKTVSSAAESAGGDADSVLDLIDNNPSNNADNDEVDDDLKGLDRNKDLEDQEEETINELDDLVAIKGSKLKSLVTSLESPQVEMIHSLKESKMDKVIRKSGVNLLKYTENKLMRVYPDNLRVDSSNYNPMPSWLHGSQLVALNYQTPDVPMWVYRGKFRDNGGCGYLLRPPFFQQKSEFKAALRQQRRVSTMLTATQQRRLQNIEERSGLKKNSGVELAVGDEVTWMSSDEDLSPNTVGRVTIIYGDGDVEVFFPEAHNEQKEFTFSSHRLILVRQANNSEGQSMMSHSSEGAAMKTWSQDRSWVGRPAKNGLVATNDDDDDDNGGSERGGSDGISDDEQNDSENDDEMWTPPRKFKDYIAHSEWATEALTLCVRVISASHLPMPAPAEGGQREKPKTVDVDSEEKDESEQDDEFMNSQGEASIEIELLGAPCDNKKWTNSRAAGSEGTKHIFDQAIVVNIAEPRLALLKFVVLRKGVAIAQTVVPVHRMRSGLRWTQLYSPEAFSDKVSADYLLTRLLVMVDRKPYIPQAPKSNLALVWGSMKGAFGKKKLPPNLVHESIAAFDANKSSMPADTNNLGDDELSRRLRQAQEEAEDLETQAFWENSGTNKPPLASATPVKSALKKSKYSGPPRRASFSAVST